MKSLIETLKDMNVPFETKDVEGKGQVIIVDLALLPKGFNLSDFYDFHSKKDLLYKAQNKKLNSPIKNEIWAKLDELVDLDELQKDLISEYIMDDFYQKETINGMVAIMAPAGALIIPPDKTGVLKELVDASNEFIHRVDIGEVRSRYTYFKFKDIISRFGFENLIK